MKIRDNVSKVAGRLEEEHLLKLLAHAALLGRLECYEKSGNGSLTLWHLNRASLVDEGRILALCFGERRFDQHWPPLTIW